MHVSLSATYSSARSCCFWDKCPECLLVSYSGVGWRRMMGVSGPLAVHQPLNPASLLLPQAWGNPTQHPFMPFPRLSFHFYYFLFHLLQRIQSQLQLRMPQCLGLQITCSFTSTFTTDIYCGWFLVFRISGTSQYPSLTQMSIVFSCGSLFAFPPCIPQVKVSPSSLLPLMCVLQGSGKRMCREKTRKFGERSGF